MDEAIAFKMMCVGSQHSMCPTVSGEGGISTNYWELAASIGPPFDLPESQIPPPHPISDLGYSSSAKFSPGKNNMTKYSQSYHCVSF